MTKAITSFTVSIEDDGQMYVSAPDFDADGHLWAIERTSVEMTDVLVAARALSHELSAMLAERLRRNLVRLEDRAAALDDLTRRAERARDQAAALRDKLGLLGVVER